MEKYGIMQDFSSIGQLEAEKRQFLLKFDHIFGPSCGSAEPLDQFNIFCNVNSPDYGEGYISKFQLSKSKTVGGVW